MDLRNEIEHIFNNGYVWYQRNLGEVVIWHEYDSTHTEYHNVYDEGGRRYTAGAAIPALWVVVSEDRATRAMEGRKPVERISMALSVRTLNTSGISHPEDYTRHLNDVIRYDGRFWEIKEYNIRGSIPGSVVVGVSGTQIYDDEDMVFDDLPPDMEMGVVRRPVAYPNDTTSTFVDHDEPGEYSTLYVDLDEDIILDGGTADS